MIVLPNWQAPKHVKSFSSTRISGGNRHSSQNFNLGHKVEDKNKDFMENHNRVLRKLANNQSPPSFPLWLNQTHSTRVMDATISKDRNADASITRKIGQILAILTADCLPILITNKEGTEVAVIHAGWRGLCRGIIEETLKKMQSNTNECIAWIGPGICGHCFEVGEEVCHQFTENYTFAPRYFFLQNRWHINLDHLAAHIFLLNGVLSVKKSNLCTFEQKNLFYSYRRDRQTGRIGTFIWLEKPKG